MRLAIVFRGISYLENGENFSKSSVINYKESYENFMKNVYPTLKTVFEEIDIYLITYYSEKLNEIISMYKPKDVLIYPSYYMKFHPECPHQINEMYKRVPFLIKKSLKLVEYEPSTHILQTRFDLFYPNPLKKEDIDVSKVNFGWVGEYNQTDDNFIIFPKEFVWRVLESLEKGEFTHGLFRFFNYSEMNYISKNVYKDHTDRPCDFDFYCIYRDKEKYYPNIN